MRHFSFGPIIKVLIIKRENQMFKVILLSMLLIVAACGSKEKKAEVVSESDVAKSSVKKAPLKKAPRAASAVTETVETIVCSYNTDTRNISSVKLANGGCEVYYEKFGEKKVVAAAKFDLNYCSQMARKVSNNLEEAGFACK